MPLEVGLHKRKVFFHNFNPMLRIFHKRPQPQSDEELLGQYRASGDLELLGALYERHVELVYGVCLKYFKDSVQAEDAVMAIFEELIVKAREHEVQKFKSWLYVLTRNHCLMQLRRDGKNIALSIEPELMQSVDLRHHTIEIGEERDEMEELKDCLEQLTQQQKQCIELFYYENRSYKEIADDTGEDLGMVRSHIQNGRRNLKICMEKKNESEIGK
jgi:RNA polymerase sigma-70 factor, ECF subfamily